MDHSRISDEEWDLVKYKLIKNAYITKVWEDTEGEIHMELTYPVDTTPTTEADKLRLDQSKLPHGFVVSKESLETNEPDLTSVLTEEMRLRGNAKAYEEEVSAANSILRRNRYNTTHPFQWYGPDPEPEHEVNL